LQQYLAAQAGTAAQTVPQQPLDPGQQRWAEAATPAGMEAFGLQRPDSSAGVASSLQHNAMYGNQFMAPPFGVPDMMTGQLRPPSTGLFDSGAMTTFRPNVVNAPSPGAAPATPGPEPRRESSNGNLGPNEYYDPPAATLTENKPPEEKKALTILDPKTGRPINVNERPSRQLQIVNPATGETISKDDKPLVQREFPVVESRRQQIIDPRTGLPIVAGAPEPVPAPAPPAPVQKTKFQIVDPRTGKIVEPQVALAMEEANSADVARPVVNTPVKAPDQSGLLGTPATPNNTESKQSSPGRVHKSPSSTGSTALMANEIFSAWDEAEGTNSPQRDDHGRAGRHKGPTGRALGLFSYAPNSVNDIVPGSAAISISGVALVPEARVPPSPPKAPEPQPALEVVVEQQPPQAPPPVEEVEQKAVEAPKPKVAAKHLPVEEDIKRLISSLTVLNAESASGSLAALVWKQQSELRCLADCLLQRVVTEPAVVEPLAMVLQSLRDRSVVPSFEMEEDGKKFQFDLKRAVMERTQAEFDSLPQDLEIEGDDGKEARNKVKGVMAFLGQLFLRQFTTTKILKMVVSSMLFRRERPDEVHLEAVCLLLKATGASLESTQLGLKLLDDFCIRLKELRSKFEQGPEAFHEKTLSAIESLMDARKRKWVSKRTNRLKDQLKSVPTNTSDGRPRLLSRGEGVAADGTAQAAPDATSPGNGPAASPAADGSPVPDAPADPVPEKVKAAYIPPGQVERASFVRETEARPVESAPTEKPDLKAVKKGLRPVTLRSSAKGK